ncbi:MAG: acyl-CoA dehydrogenase family protein [Cumulibacter sp.]
MLRSADDATLPHLQRVMLEAPGRRIARGTTQIQRRIIAQRVLGMPK